MQMKPTSTPTTSAQPPAVSRRPELLGDASPAGVAPAATAGLFIAFSVLTCTLQYTGLVLSTSCCALLPQPASHAQLQLVRPPTEELEKVPCPLHVQFTAKRYRRAIRGI
jgi:hypothetical protein